MVQKGGTEPSQRQLRVGEELRHSLAWILERDELRDPDVAGVAVTVTEVAASPDLKNATVYVMPLAAADLPADEVEAFRSRVVGGLNRAVPYLRGRVAREVRLKYVPKLRFETDTTFDRADRIDSLLASVAEDLGPDGPDGEAS